MLDLLKSVPCELHASSSLLNSITISLIVFLYLVLAPSFYKHRITWYLFQISQKNGRFLYHAANSSSKNTDLSFQQWNRESNNNSYQKKKKKNEYLKIHFSHGKNNPILKVTMSGWPCLSLLPQTVRWLWQIYVFVGLDQRFFDRISILLVFSTPLVECLFSASVAVQVFHFV